MKKALSILLVAAALFGFYGSAVNVNDILACKDYWEEAGEKSTADMNKLEDGLNQLKDNEQAYLDGLDQVADGEEALADGEAALADGEAQYAQGKADYAAAPGKLAAGEKQLAEGQESYKQLKTLIKGLQEVKKHGASTTKTHDMYWHDAFSHTVSNDVIKKMAAGKKTNDSPGLKQARTVITQTLISQKDDVSLIESLTGASNIVNDAKAAKSYAKFNTAMKKATKAFEEAEAQIKALVNMASTYSGQIGNMLDSNLATNTTGVPQSGDVDEETGEFTNTKAFNQCNLVELKTGIQVLEGTEAKINAGITQAEQGIAQLDAGIKQLTTAISQLPDGEQKTALEQQKAGLETQKTTAEATKTALEGKLAQVSGSKDLLNQAVTGRTTAQKMIQGVIDNYGDKFEAVAASNSDIASLYGLMKAIANNVVINPSTGAVVGADESNQVFYGYVSKLKGGLDQAVEMLNSKLPVVQSSKSTFEAWSNGYGKLADGKDGKGSSDLASTEVGIPFAFSNMLTNKTIRSAINTYDKGLVKELKKYTGANKYKLKNEDFDKFDKDITYIANKIIPRAQKVLAKVKANAEKQLADGKAQLAEGRKSYAAAPGKLADAERQLEEGRQQLAEGRQALADGKAQLAQYEDGEQQVRDGLATLTGTEADLDLQSIADRLNGDVDFDNGDNHLDIEEGLAAVEVGRGYQAEDGELITAEIMARAVGTGALLGAGALAVIAAILSFLKKNKGAGVFAILAAAAGAFGAFYGTNAGTYFSDIAGSTAGSAGWVAAGILGAIALVHAIVHFTAKPQA